MGYILNIETSTTKCSVCLSKKEKPLFVKELNAENYTHSENLHLFIQQLLNDNSISIKDIIAVSISKGPGSYTGLRIGTATAKGFCFALNIPLIAINTLEILAAAYTPEKEEIIISTLDARREEVYALVLNFKKEIIEPTKSVIIDKDSFSHFTKKNRVVLIGNGIKKIKDITQNPNFIYAENVLLPSAKDMSKFAYKLFKNKRFEDVAYFEPFYLKEFKTSTPKKR